MSKMKDLLIDEMNKTLQKPTRPTSVAFSHYDNLLHYCHNLEHYCVDLEGKCDHLNEAIHLIELRQDDLLNEYYDKGFDTGIMIYAQIEKDEYERYSSLPQHKRDKIDKIVKQLSREITKEENDK